SDLLVGLGVVRESSAHAAIMPRASDMRAVRSAPISRTHAPKSRNGSGSDASGAPPDDTSPSGSLIWAPRSLIWDDTDSVRCVERLHDLGLDAAAVAHRVAVALRPGPDRGETFGIRALGTSPRTPGRCATRAADPPTGGDVGGERISQRPRVVRGEVDLVLHPVEREARAARTGGQFLAVEVVGENRDRLLRHAASVFVGGDRP